ncbi:FUSC family protein [Rhizobium sp. BK538]|uniref:FUSC family protein n=1 Tax=Rhizobium sp. BK538 TaxID=2586984 RepID=UPI0016093A2A|nr:FUSC family protein [Rhizobium sp. BK538]MBB4169019.1 putative membrane protein YccC [Rhizobium sp. BK538]
MSKPVAMETRYFPALTLPFGITWPAVVFAVRTTAASLTALYIALALDFGEAKWAAMTVWVVAQPTRGMSLSKAQYRLAGTLVGAFVSILLVSAFAQTPELFFLALASWLAICTAVSTALRNFRSYAAVLAGYTAAIVGIAGANQPGLLFDLAVARVAYISLGVVTEALFAALFSPGRPIDAMRGRLEAFLRSTATLTSRTLRGEDTAAAIQSTLAAAIELETQGEYAAAGSSQARRAYTHLRATIVSALSQLAAVHALVEHTSKPEEPTSPQRADLAERFALVAAGGMRTPGEIDELILGLDGARRQPSSSDANFHEISLAHRRDALISSGVQALLHFGKVGSTDAAARTDFSFHLDVMAIVANGLRAFFAVLAAATFWIESAWPSGGSMMVIVAVVVGLFASRPNSVLAGIGFVKGAVAAIAVAGICNFALLPEVTLFPALAAITAPFLILGGIAMRVPSIVAPASSFTLFVWNLIGPDNAARADFGPFANSGLALLMGIACGTVMFALIFPYRPASVRRNLVGAVQRDLQSIGRSAGSWSEHQWLTRMADRISRHLAASRTAPPVDRERELRAMLASIVLGDSALGLSRLLEGDDRELRRPVATVLRRISLGEPERLAEQASRAATRLEHCSSREALLPARRRQLAVAAAYASDIAATARFRQHFLEIEGEKP